MLNSDDIHLSKAPKDACNNRGQPPEPYNWGLWGERCHAHATTVTLNHNSTVWRDRCIVDDFVTQWGIVSLRVSLPYDRLRFSPDIAASVPTGRTTTRRDLFSKLLRKGKGRGLRWGVWVQVGVGVGYGT